MMRLDIKKLIEKAENLIFDGRLNGALKAKIPVQDISIGEFKNFKLSILAERDGYYGERLENVIDIPLENTPFNLFLWTGDFTQDGLKPEEIVCSGYIEDEGLSYILYCANDQLKNFISDKKRNFAKGYGYKFWGEIINQRDKYTLFDMMNDFIKTLFKT